MAYKAYDIERRKTPSKLPLRSKGKLGAKLMEILEKGKEEKTARSEKEFMRKLQQDYAKKRLEAK